MRVAAWSPAKQQQLWQREVSAYAPSQWTIGPAAQWPVVEDLDGDGACEVVLPVASSQQEQGGKVSYDTRPWGELALLDGKTGKPRWTRRLMALDQQVDHFLAGPDIDGDGVREVFTATLWTDRFDLYVDALSGHDGKTLWRSRRALVSSGIGWDESFARAQLRWWRAGGDGRPLLVVPALSHYISDDPTNRASGAVCMFSAGTGELARVAVDLEVAAVTDADGDGASDLFALDADGELSLYPGVVERWRRVGLDPKPIYDFDGDGVRDFIAGRSEARSAATGEVLWTIPPRSSMGNDQSFARTGEPVVGGLPLDSRGQDVNGDGTPDLIECVELFGQELSSPLRLISGKTGHVLWTAGFAIREFGPVQRLEVRDLDRDGAPEIVVVVLAEKGLTDQGSLSREVQLWLVVLSGEDGSVRFKHPLTAPYGLAAAFPYENDAALAVRYVDADGDGTLDIIAPAEVSPQTRQIELRVISGETGKRLWGRPVKPPFSRSDSFAHEPPVVPADIDGDGRPELIVAENDRIVLDPRASQEITRITALDSASGEERWQATEQGRLTFSRGQGSGWLSPVILRQKDKPPLICVLMGDSPSRLVFLDHNGSVLQRLDLQAGEIRPFVDPFPLHAVDADGDGTDEVATLLGNSLAVLRPDEPEEPLWRRELAKQRDTRVLGALPARGGSPAAILTREDGDVVALSAANGELLWRCQGIGAGASAHLLSAGGEVPPHLLFVSENRSVSVLRRPADPEEDWGRKRFAHAAAPTLTVAGYDPRMLRRLPWAAGEDDLDLGTAFRRPARNIIGQGCASYPGWATIASRRYAEGVAPPDPAEPARARRHRRSRVGSARTHGGTPVGV